MQFSRRYFLAAASAAALTATSRSLAAPAPLAAQGNVVPTTNTSSGTAPSLRSILNVGFSSGGGNEYRFIDHFLIAEQYGPSGSSWSSGALWTQSIAADGYPKISLTSADNRTFGGGIRIPASFQYGEVGSNQFYVLRWKGNGDVRLMLQAGSWTYQASKSKNATVVSGDRWKTTSGSDTYIVLNFTGPAQLFPLIVFATDPAKTGARLSNLQFYRLDDEADLLAGKVFRTAYKQSIVSLCPSAIRFMDWVGGNNSKLTRFESRTLPTYAAYGGNSNWVASPPYGETTGANQYALAAVAGTPSTPLHGEIVTCRIGSGMTRTGAKTITAVSNSNPGRVTATGHGYVTGDVIVHQFASGVMPKLHLLPCKITVIDPDNYAIGVDTTTFGSFSGSAKANQFITLNVGGRGAYPVTFPIPTTFASHYGDGYIAKGDYKTFIFDKTIAAQRDTAGNYVYGVWMFNDAGANNGHAGGVPLEICTALVNEVNAMKPARTVGMWTNIPHLGLCSMDPDFSGQSSWGIQAVNTILNGANGRSGLTTGQLFVEFSNETWNSGGSAFAQTYYLAYRGYLRWPASGTADYSSMVALRSVINVEDIKSSAYSSSRLRFVLSGQGTLGVSGLNQYRIDGTAYFLKDPLNVWGAAAAPMTHHDYFAYAGYFVASPSFDAAYLAKYADSWVANLGNAAAQEAICSAYVKGIVDPTLGGNETVDRYRLALLPAYISKMKTYGKAVIMYEGGWDHDIQPISAGSTVTATIPYAWGATQAASNMISGMSSTYVAALQPGYFIVGYGIPAGTRVVSASGTSIVLSANPTVTLAFAQFVAFAPQQMFLLAVKRSSSWASAMLTYFNQFGLGSGMPADYVQSNIRWGHTLPTAYGFGKTEWSDLDTLWQQQQQRNSTLN
ncbi:hypothetical protein [Bradyrhizobium manausense]|uniref:hypothetical protein n=1 Tax=Bradyrhizobium manausense TaxID=989370 RepID=UPI001BADCC23|nr:hypothetical protein [Bradyrhizobium manausense]MBR0725039.1 hypothetical protein [Bradyrhizobium manausense]